MCRFHLHGNITNMARVRLKLGKWERHGICTSLWEWHDSTLYCGNGTNSSLLPLALAWLCTLASEKFCALQCNETYRASVTQALSPCISIKYRQAGGVDCPWSPATIIYVCNACHGVVYITLYICTLVAPWIHNGKPQHEIIWIPLTKVKV